MNTSPAQPHFEEAGGNRRARVNLCWILGADAELRRRIARLLKERTCKTVESEKSLPECVESIPRPPGPALIVLDTGNDADWGVRMIDEIKRRRIRAPMVVLTETFSRDFGSKILSQGIRYYFSRDFCEQEFSQVVASLLEAGNAN